MILNQLFLLLVAGNPCHRQTREFVVQKSTADHRAYLGLELPNRLKVLLVSDPRAERVGASLAVSSGGMDDPNDIPGLAHFTEHAILLGSTKYPITSDFQETLALSGGKINAYTSFDSTVYSFEVGHWALEKSMDMFAHFFISPLFDEAIVTSEITAVDNEYKLKKEDANRRFSQAERAALNTTHKYAAFGAGSIDTLLTGPKASGLNIRTMLTSHLERHYSANTMHLVVYAKQDIATLKKLAAPFSNIPDRRIVLSDAGSPFNTSNLAKNVVIDAGKDAFKVQFVLGPASHALKFIHHLLADAGIESLREALRQNDFTSSLQPGALKNYKTFSLFAFHITPTAEVRARKDELLRIIFAYINAVQQGITEERYQNFLSQPNPQPSSPFDFTKDLLEKLHEGASFDTVLGYNRPPFDARMLKDTLSQFNTSNFNLYEGKELHESFLTEPWYGAKYTSAPIAKDLLGKLGTVTADMYDITLPEQKVLPTKEGFQTTVRLVANSTTGYIIAANQESGPPSVLIEFDALHSAKMRYFVEVLKEIKTSSFNFPFLSEFNLSPRLKMKGTSLILESLDLAKDVKTISTLLSHSGIAQNSFDQARDRILSKPRGNAKTPWEMDRLTEPVSFDYSQVSLADFTFEDFEACYDALKNSQINFIASGAIPDRLLLEHRDLLLSNLGSNRSMVAQPLPRLLTRVGDFVYAEGTLPYAIIYYLHMHMHKSNTTSYALAYATAQLIRIPFYNQLRTKEQLAYSLRTLSLAYAPSGRFALVMESDHNPIYLEARIEAFLDTFYKSVEATPEEKIKDKLTNIVGALDLPPPNLKRSSENYWEEVRSQYLAAEKVAQVKQGLKTVSKAQLLAFWQANLLKSPTRRKISFHGKPKQGDRSLPAGYALGDCGEQILDIAAWREAAVKEMQ